VEFTASHRFGQPFERVSAAFLDPGAHVGRHELAGDRDVRAVRAIATERSLEVQIVRTVEGDVPAFAQKVVASRNTVTTTDRWELGDGAIHGTSVVEAGNVPGTATVVAVIEPGEPGSSTYAMVLDLALTIPLIGDRFVKLLRPPVMEIIAAEFAGWDRWFERMP
jgi:hypothetical protein